MADDFPYEVAYRAYLRAAKEHWANLDVEAVDLKSVANSPMALPSSHTWGTLYCMGHIGTAGGCVMCGGTIGTALCYSNAQAE